MFAGAAYNLLAAFVMEGKRESSVAPLGETHHHADAWSPPLEKGGYGEML